MASLFDRGDKASSDRIFREVVAIVKMAFAGEARNTYDTLTRLASDKILSVTDPIFEFPLQRCAIVDGIEVRVTAALRPSTPGGNHSFEFGLAIRAGNWRLNCSLELQAAWPTASWVPIPPVYGYCSDRTVALPALTDLSQTNLSFSLCA